MRTDVHLPTDRTDRAVRQLETRWDEYRRALRGTDQVVFDRLFEQTRAHANAHEAYADASEVRYRHVERAALLSILIEQQKHIDDLEDRLDHLETDLNEGR